MFDATHCAQFNCNHGYGLDKLQMDQIKLFKLIEFSIFLYYILCFRSNIFAVF